MVSLLEALIVCLVIYFSVKLLSFVIRRLKIALKLRAVSKIDGVRVKFCGVFRLFSPKTTKLPVAEITLKGVVYPVYIFDCGSTLRYVHIASEEFAATYSKLGGAVPRSRPAARYGKQLNAIDKTVVPVRASRPKTKLLPRLEVGDGSRGSVRPVLLFSPVPRELTYVTREKTSIKIAFTGDVVGKWTVFTKSSLYNYIDRESRDFYDKAIFNDYYY